MTVVAQPERSHNPGMPLLAKRCLPLLMLLAGAGKGAWAADKAASCEDLANLHQRDLTVTAATSITEPLSLASGMGGPVSVPGPFCRVQGFLSPSSDSHIGFEVWLPAAASWNHRLEAVGNGGFAGSLNFRAMLPGLARGYATMTTDEGHINKAAEPVEDVSWALGHPEKLIDYGYRSEHVTTLAAKQIIEAYYGSAPAHSFYTGCSAGGIQGLVEMLRFPKDYDGYVIGDATPAHMGQELGAFWNTMATSLSDADAALKPTQVAAIHKEVLRQCAGKDGGAPTDAFLTNPVACKFDLKPLACSAGQDAASCLSPTQIAEVNKVYQGPINSATHQPILAGVTPGGEGIWDRYFTGKTNPVGTERPWAGFMAYAAFGDPDYLSSEKYLKFNFGTDVQAIGARKISGETLASVFDTSTRDLDPVKLEGGKVIQYHGWDDANIPALEAVNLYRDVVADQAKRHHLTQAQAMEETQKFYRLFMVQGMGHCMGGDGPNNFGQNPRPAKGSPQEDVLSALEVWVDSGVAPQQFLGSHMDPKTHAADLKRPICAYPKNPVWNGSGDVKDAASFTCAEPSKPAGK